jgi:hypothetical protein
MVHFFIEGSCRGLFYDVGVGKFGHPKKVEVQGSFVHVALLWQKCMLGGGVLGAYGLGLRLGCSSVTKCWSHCEGCMKTICWRTEESHGRPWSSWPVARPSSQQSAVRTLTALSCCIRKSHKKTFLAPLDQQHFIYIETICTFVARATTFGLCYCIFYVVSDDSLFVCCCMRISTWCCTCGLAGPLRMPSELLRYLTRNTRPTVRRETIGLLRSLLDYVISYLRNYYYLFIFAIKDGFAAGKANIYNRMDWFVLILESCNSLCMPTLFMPWTLDA